MKKLKKFIILSIIIISLIIYLIYNFINENEEQIIEEDVYMNLDLNTNLTETKKIVLHIIGEVNNPRSNRN